MKGVSKPRMLVILSAAIAQAEVLGGGYVYVQALRDLETVLRGGIPRFNEQFWADIIRESDKRSVGGFAAMPPERLREVSARGKGNFNRAQRAAEAGQKGALARLAASTPEQRSEWASLGAKAVNAKRLRAATRMWNTAAKKWSEYE